MYRRRPYDLLWQKVNASLLEEATMLQKEQERFKYSLNTTAGFQTCETVETSFKSILVSLWFEVVSLGVME